MFLPLYIPKILLTASVYIISAATRSPGQLSPADTPAYSQLDYSLHCRTARALTQAYDVALVQFNGNGMYGSAGAGPYAVCAGAGYVTFSYDKKRDRRFVSIDVCDSPAVRHPLNGGRRMSPAVASETAGRSTRPSGRGWSSDKGLRRALCSDWCVDDVSPNEPSAELSPVPAPLSQSLQHDESTMYSHVKGLRLLHCHNACILHLTKSPAVQIRKCDRV